jgi:hypothetical protein
MGTFANTQELLTFADQFVKERIAALEKDVKHCIDTKPYAPMPAIGYCFSTIDLHLTLAPRPNKGEDTTYRAAEYMKNYMNYTAENVEHVQKIFRHKVVHLAIPNPIFKDSQNRIVTWWYMHGDNPLHLTIKPTAPNSELTVTPTWKIPYDHEFYLSIERFVKDIKNSVDDGAGHGYLARLKNSTALQSRFKDAICEIYSV